MILNETPVRTSKSFGINNINLEDVDFTRRIDEFDNLTISGDTENFSINNETSKTQLVYGLGDWLEMQSAEHSNQNLKIVAEENKNKILNIDFEFDEENANLVDNIEIEAKSKANATVVIKYGNLNDDTNYYHNGIIRASLEPDAKINIIIINMLNVKSDNFINIENNVQSNAKLNYTIVDFGGKNSVSNYYSNIIGKNAENNLNTIYLGIDKQLFDLNYIVELKEEKAKTNIEVQGALKDNARKNFKGTIDFKKGCKKAIGGENEFCTLLSDTAKSKALPMLLCTEEDVEGSHSTASGKVDNERLFYIMSRGISYKDAMKLIVKANFSKIIETIKDDELKNKILNEIDKRLD